jgi:chromosome segregation ATPase
MSQHMRITCPHCQRPDLRIRPENIGLFVRCKHCGNDFRAQPPTHDCGSMTIQDYGEASQRTDAITLAEEKRKVQVELEILAKDHAAAVQLSGDAKERLESLEREVRTLQGQLEEARQNLKAELDLRQEIEAGHLALAKTLEGELRASQDQVEALRIEVRSLQEATLSPAADPQLAAAFARERDAIATERDRLVEESEQGRLERDRLVGERDCLQGEVQSLHAQFEVLAAEAGRLGNLSAELEALRAGRDQLEAERQQSASMAEHLRSQFGELERSLAAANAGHEEARGRWQSDRRELLDQWEQERRNLVDGAERDRREQSDADRRRHEESRTRLQQEADRLRSEVEAASRARDEALPQVKEITAERDRLHERFSAVDVANQHLQAERDRLDHELTEARSRVAAISREGDELAVQIRELQTALDRQRQQSEADSREHTRAQDALRQEREAVRRRDEELKAVRLQAEENRRFFDQETGQLRADLETMRCRTDELRGERDRLLQQHDKELADRQDADRGHQTERDRLNAAVEVARLKAQAATSRSEALDEQLRTLQSECDRRCLDRNADAEAKAQEQVQALESLRQDLEAVQAERDAERVRAARGDAEQTDLRRRLAEALGEQRAAVAQTERLEAEVRSLRDRSPESPPELSDPIGHPRSARPADAVALRQRVEELVQQLRLMQEANERLRSFLAVFGTHSQTIGKDVV